MLVDKKPTNSKKSILIACVITMLILLPFAHFHVSYLYYNDLQLAWIYFNERPFASAGYAYKYNTSSLDFYIITHGFLLTFLAIIAWRIYYAKSRSQVDKTLRVNMVTDKEPHGLIKIQRKDGRGRVGPYIEIFINNQFVAGLMGEESVEVQACPGRHIVQYRISQHEDTEMEKKLQKYQNKPLSQQIDKTIISRGCTGEFLSIFFSGKKRPFLGYDYCFSIPIDLKCDEVIKYSCLRKTVITSKKLEDISLPLMTEMIYCWKENYT